MEDEIKEELEKRYKNLEIEVYFIEFRKYCIVVKCNGITLNEEYTWDNNFTKEVNISYIEEDINQFIIDCFRRKENE